MTSGAGDRKDLTRWNRAGLERFRYIDANAITLLETIRGQLADRFPHWDLINDQSVGESATERRERLQKQYALPRQDWAWEIARTFARATHILTEHADAFANEGYLQTATQWEFLRRLVTMLDYHPAPPSSASTTLAIIAKEKADTGAVEAGLQVKYTPEDGGPAVIFETLDDVVVTPALNGLHLHGWDANPETFDPFATAPDARYWKLAEDSKASAGQVGLLIDDKAGQAVQVTDVEDGHAMITAAVAGGKLAAPQDKPSFILSKTVLSLVPDEVYQPRLNGADVFRLDHPGRFAPDQVVVWKKAGTTGFARVSAADRSAIRLADIIPAGSDVSGAGVEFFTAGFTPHEQFVANKNEWRFDEDDNSTAGLLVAAADQSDNLTGTLLASHNWNRVSAQGYKHLTSFAGHAMYFFLPDKSEKLATSRAEPAKARLVFDGGSGQILSGDRMVAQSRTEHMAAILVTGVEEREDSFALTYQFEQAVLNDIERLYGPFTETLHPAGHDRNPTPVAADALLLELKAAELPAELTPGRTVVIEPLEADDTLKPFKAAVLEVNVESRKRAKRKSAIIEVFAARPRLILDAAPEDFAGYTLGNTIIHANAVIAGHGESKPERVLGSGDATRTGQTFVIDKEDIAFIADATMETGVRADLVVQVDGRIYHEVSTLADSEASDPHYTVRLTEDGFVKLTFGDGCHGRRLPTGRNNVTARYRIGTGLAGNNLPAASLETLAGAHPLVDAVRQPTPTAGGQDIEDIAGIRNNAPSHLRALGRGVSLSDLEHLARSQPGVWHAKAFFNASGAERHELVDIVVVPAGDAPLGELDTALQERLSSLSPPGIVLRISRFEPVLLPLSVTLRIDTEGYDTDAVEENARTALFERFSLVNRSPGMQVYLSEIYETVEAIEGVINSSAVLFDRSKRHAIVRGDDPVLKHLPKNTAGDVWAAWPQNHQVIYIADRQTISISRQELVL